MTQSRLKLKELFKNGLKPNEADFAALIDSLMHAEDDGIFSSRGMVGIGTDEPKGYLHVNPILVKKKLFRKEETIPYILVGDLNDYHLIISVNGISARNGKDASDLELNPEGDVNIKGSFLRSSDRSLKENVTPINKGLEEVLKLNPVSFTWKGNTSEIPDIKYGFIAQEMEKIVPDITYTSKRNSLKAISEMELIPVLVKSIQEQQTQIKNLESRLEKLEKLMQKK